MPTAACLKRSMTDPVSENSPVPIATASTPKVTMAPMASLNADSLITVCATRSRILTCRKIGTSVAGSVEARRADRDANDQKNRHIGNLALLRYKAGDGADGQNKRPRHQSMFRNLDCG